MDLLIFVNLGKPKVKPGSLKRTSVEPTKDASELSEMPPQILAFPKEDDLAKPSAGDQHNPPAKHGEGLGDPLLRDRDTPLGYSGEKEPEHHVAPLTLDKPLIRLIWSLLQKYGPNLTVLPFLNISFTHT